MKGAILADFHCGHEVGLTPPDWQNKKSSPKLSAIRKACWDFFDHKIKLHGPFDFILGNGDHIDGRGEKSGSLEVIELDRNRQCEMAEIAFRRGMRKGTKVVLTYGTAYHTGTLEDWEDRIADNLNAKIGAHEWVDADGVIFDLKHHCGSSAVPHGRHTAQAREHLWAQLWEARGQNPRSDVIIRSHVHYFSYCGGHNWLALTTPALQGWGSRFGSRRCSGTVDYGFLVFECHKGKFSWQSITLGAPVLQTKAVKL